MRRTFTRLAIVVLAGFTGNALAAGVGYAQATGYFKKDTRPTLYQPLNLLDGRDATAWCTTTSDPLNELLSFGFTGPLKIDEVRITTGNNFNEATFNEHARAHKLVFKNGKQTQSFALEDKRGLQVLYFDKPWTTARVTIEVTDQFPAEDPDAPVCLTDVVFVSEGKVLNGPWLTTKLKYDKSIAALMGTWFAGYEGGPDRFLALNYDGTFRYSYEPYDVAKSQPKAIEGAWDVSGQRLIFDIAGKKSAVKFSKDAAKKEGAFLLTFDGELPADLKGPFRSMP